MLVGGRRRRKVGVGDDEEDGCCRVLRSRGSVEKPIPRMKLSLVIQRLPNEA